MSQASRAGTMLMTMALALVPIACGAPAGSRENTAREEIVSDRTAEGPKIIVTSVLVDDQEKALTFYTDVLGFEKKTDVPAGGARWLTVVSRHDPDGVELLLEPNVNPAAKAYQAAIFEQGIPATMFGVEDIGKEYERLKGLGVEFRGEPSDVGTAIVAVLDDTCGNLILLAQRKEE